MVGTRTCVVVVLALLMLFPSVNAVTTTTSAVNGTVVTLAFEGTPPFTINIRSDANIGDPGGAVWATTYNNYVQVNLSLVDNPSGRFFYGVEDSNNWSPMKAFNIKHVPVQEPAYDETVLVTANFGVDEPGVKSMSGFNHGMDNNTPSDGAVELISPRLYVQGQQLLEEPGLYDRVQSLGARFTFEVSTWGLEGAWTPPPERKKPWEDLAKYEQYIRDVADATQSYDVVYEVWNEPSNCNKNEGGWPYRMCIGNPPGVWPDGTFFIGTEQNWFDTFGTAHDTLREELGQDILISGPSYSGYDLSYMGRFIEYAKDNSWKVDVLAWHELSGRADSDLPQMQDDLEYMREQYIDNPEYASVGIQEININENQGEAQHLRPGSSISKLYFLEQGGADMAGRACWRESNNYSNCVWKSLNGMLTMFDKEPRGTWWANKWYVDSVSDRVQSTSSRYKVVAIASKSTNISTEAQVILAHNGYDIEHWLADQDPQYWADVLGLEEPPEPGDLANFTANLTGNFSLVNVSLTLENLDAIPFLTDLQEIGVAVYKIPFNLSDTNASREAALLEPMFVEDMALPVTNGQATLLVENIGLYEVWQVKILDYVPTEANVTVDFSNAIGDPDHSMFGLNHGVLVGVTPEEYLDQIEIGYYRDGTSMWWSSDLASYMLDRSPNSKVNLFGFPGGYTPWWDGQLHGDSNRPFDPWFEDPENTGVYNWTVYERYLSVWSSDFNNNSNWVQMSQEGRFVVNIWNEPQNNPWPFVPHGNGKGPFNGTEQQWFDTFKFAHDFLKTHAPYIKLCAPTYGTDASFNGNLSNFMEFAKAEGLDIYAICLHAVANTPGAFEKYATGAAEARELYVNAEYGVQEIHVDENLNSDNYLYPANTLGWLEWNERAGVDYATMNTGGGESDGGDSFNGALGGLLNISTWEPRPLFWVVKTYSDMLTGRRSYETVYNAVPGFASSNGTHGLVMFGAYERPNDEVNDLNITMQLSNLDSVGSPPYTITLTRTDYGSDGRHVQLAPIPVDQFVTSNTDELFEVTIREHDVYFITVTPS